MEIVNNAYIVATDDDSDSLDFRMGEWIFFFRDDGLIIYPPGNNNDFYVSHQEDDSGEFFLVKQWYSGDGVHHTDVVITGWSIYTLVNWSIVHLAKPQT